MGAVIGAVFGLNDTIIAMMNPPRPPTRSAGITMPVLPDATWFQVYEAEKAHSASSTIDLPAVPARVITSPRAVVDRVSRAASARRESTGFEARMLIRLQRGRARDDSPMRRYTPTGPN